MTPRATEWRFRLVLAAFSTLVTLGFAELAARVVLRPAAPRTAEGTPISEFSQTLGWRTRAGGSQRIRREDFDVTVSMNSLGLRGPEIPYEAAPAARRLAIMGDSFAHGYYAEEPDTLRGLLGRSLQACRVDVLNAGGPGYSTDQEWLYFNEEIHRYRPNEVVLLFFYNDLQFNIEPRGTADREKPMFLDRNGTLELLKTHLSAPPEDRASAGATTATPLGTPTFRGSALWGFAASRLQRSRPDWSRALADRGLAPSLSLVPPKEFLPFGPIDTRERDLVEEMWKRTAAILRGFRDDVRRGGAGFSVFYVPARFEANDEAWAFVLRRYEPARPWKRDAVRARLETTLFALDIPLLEATSTFAAAERTTDKAYLPIDGHWNARGNGIAFDGLFPVMRRAFSCGA